MTDFFLKVFFVITSGIIFWQDTKHREVYWFLYPMLAFISFLISFHLFSPVVLFLNLFINLLFVSLLIGITLFYYRFVKKVSFINNVIGSGDVVLFYCITPTLPSFSFVTMFVFSLVFSLVFHQIFKRNHGLETVPLAGYIALYFSILYCFTFYFDFRQLFPV